MIRDIRKPRITESQIKGQVTDYLKARNIFSYHLLQGLGSYPGLPDRVLHYRNRVIYLELKTPKGYLSQYQQLFQSQCVADKIDYWVISSIEELIDRLAQLDER